MAAQAGLYQQYAADSSFTAGTAMDTDLEEYIDSVCGDGWDKTAVDALEWDAKATIKKFEYTANGYTAKFDGSTWDIIPDGEKESESGSAGGGS